MIDYDQALRAARAYMLNIVTNVEASDLRIMEDRVREFEVGWVCPFNHRIYLERGDYRYQLAGNLPIVVLRGTGEVRRLHQEPWETIDSAIAALAGSMKR